MFERELVFSEVFSEAIEVFKENFNIILMFSLLQLLAGSMNLLYALVFKKTNVSDYLLSNPSALINVGSSVEIILSLCVLLLSLVLNFVLLQKILQHYFDDHKETGEQFSYALPRVFRWFSCIILTELALFIPTLVIMIGAGFIVMNLGSEVGPFVIMGIMIIIYIPALIATTFMKYKIIVDDTRPTATFRTAVALTFKYFIKLIPILLLGGVFIGLTLGLQYGLNQVFSNSVWYLEILSYPLSFLWILLELTLLIQYLNLDWYENQEAYNIIEEY